MDSGRDVFSGLCEGCGYDGKAALLYPFCECEDRLFHFECLTRYLLATLDKPCPHCHTLYTDDHIRRQSYTPTYKEFFASGQILPNQRVMKVALIIVALLLLFRPEDTTGYGYPTLIFILLAMYLRELSIGLLQLKKGYPHTILYIDGHRPLDITAQKRQIYEEQYKRRAEEWLRMARKAKEAQSGENNKRPTF